MHSANRFASPLATFALMSLILGTLGVPDSILAHHETPPAVGEDNTGSQQGAAKEGAESSPQAPGTQEARRPVPAPEFPEGLEWFNTSKPLRLTDLRGKVVLLDFWTYGCINCMHVIPDLKYLEDKYGDTLAVVGVHSAKFTNEQDSDNIRQAILRYERAHPVVNDRDFIIWRTYGVRAWPTLVLIDPEGDLVGGVAGEGQRELLDRVIGVLVEYGRAHKLLDARPLPLQLERDRQLPGALSFPGKVLADAVSRRLFIADSNHHRIVIADLDGTVVDVAGSGEIGAQDGPFESARFSWPQGMALAGPSLYVADTDNHLIRRLDLASRTVETVAGTGVQAQRFNVPGKGRQVALNSPWDLQRVGRQLYIAMAGPHQIWVLDLDSGAAKPFAGSGREGIIDGLRLQGALAQPSGLATDGRVLYVADSEVSGIRSVDLEPEGRLKTIVGVGLFEFGDRDGTGPDVRLQHPLGIAHRTGTVYIADTYNHKIKRLNPARRTVRTFLGSGKPGHTDGRAAEFYEPSGLSIAGGKLYIADTNNHAIRVADLATGHVSSLTLSGLAAPSAVAGFAQVRWGATQVLALPPQTLSANSQGQFAIDLRLPEGYKLNPRAALRYRLHLEGDGLRVDASAQRFAAMAPTLPLTIPFTAGPGAAKAQVKLDLTFYYCPEDEKGVCLIQSLTWTVPVQTTEDGGRQEIRLAYAARLSELE